MKKQRCVIDPIIIDISIFNRFFNRNRNRNRAKIFLKINRKKSIFFINKSIIFNKIVFVYNQFKFKFYK
jgi:hypothetical protein